MADFELSGNIVNLETRSATPGTLRITHGIIASIDLEPHAKYDQYILPGFVDAHVHIESSMLVPSEFARLAVPHGTVATVSDPHEIGNVLGIEGVRYMIANGAETPFKFYFGAPSCVPATTFETAGATIDADDIRSLFERDGLLYLSEMMNFPGVLSGDPLVMQKIRIAQELGKAIDGHAPGVRGDDARRYIEAGISTDHECFTLDEALDKLKYGMKISIREGSAAKNFEALHSLISTHTQQVMLCSDDKHPNDLADGHINSIVRRALRKGHNVYDALACACRNPVEHYRLDVGLLQVGGAADCIVVDNLEELNVLQTYISGECVADRGATLIRSVKAKTVNVFKASRITPQSLKVRPRGTSLRVIEALDGQLITNELQSPAKVVNGNVVSDTVSDVLKLVVVNRYSDTAPAIGFIKNFGLQNGALASCVAHDSHNIIAVGVSDSDIASAVNGVIDARGGVAVADNDALTTLPLPVAGIMSAQDGYDVAHAYSEIDALAKKLGSKLSAPFMTLSFMALLVIPALKLSDLGLFDGASFAFTDVFAKE